MAKNEKIDLDVPNLLTVYAKDVDKAFKLAVKNTFLQHKLANNPIAVSRRGKAIMLEPDKIPSGKKEKEFI